MRTRALILVAAVVSLLVAAGPTFAHHGAAAYDMKNVVTVTGKVTDFEFINPHCQLYFEATNSKGETEAWQTELTAPAKLSRAGWTKHSLKPGDTVTVTGPVAKNGKLSIWIQKLVGPDGNPLPLSED